MLKTVEKSQAKKITDIAVTYRAGKDHVFGSCPNTCPLNPVQDKSTDEIDWNYLKAVLHAVAKKGKAFTFTHFKLENEPLDKLFLLHDIKVNENTTTINRSTDSLDEAVAVHSKMFPTAVTLPYENVRKNFTHKNVRFIRCPAEYSKRVTCKNCQLCTRKLRDFVIVFYAHGSQKKLVGDEKNGGCYGTFGNVRYQWEHTRKNVKNVSKYNFNSFISSTIEQKQLKDFANSLDTGTLLRHHVVGDFGKIKYSVQNKNT
jgi:hypothetical protein